MSHPSTNGKTISFRGWRRPSLSAVQTTKQRDSEGNSKCSHSTSDERPPTAHQRPTMPVKSCLVVNMLVNFLLRNKLHKNDLFLTDGKSSEKKKLMECINDGRFPEKLHQFSSRSVSCVVLHTLTHTYAPLLPVITSSDQADLSLKSACNLVNLIADAEHRQLVESLLLLLSKLSLRGTPQMNTTTLGKLVAAELVGVRDQSNEGALDRHRIGKFLVENAFEIVRRCHSTSNNRAAMSSSVQLAVGALSRSTSLANAVAILSRTSDPSLSQQTQSAKVATGERLSLDSQLATRISIVLTAIVESNESKQNIYVTQASYFRQNAVVRFLEGCNNEDLIVDDVVALSSGLCFFLSTRIRPLINEESVEVISPTDGTALLTWIQDFLQRCLASFQQDVILLLLATVRLGLEDGTELQSIVSALAPCMFPIRGHADKETAETRTRILFMNIHIVTQPLLAKRQRELHCRQFRSCVYVVVWAAKCHRRASRRFWKRQPWSEAIAQTLCNVVETLLEQTRAYPMQLRRLYLDPGERCEVSTFIDQILHSTVETERFSPHATAFAVRMVLTNHLPPLSEAIPLTPAQSHLKSLLNSHLHLIRRYETHPTVLVDLERTIKKMVNQKNDERSIGDVNVQSQAADDADGDDTKITEKNTLPNSPTGDSLILPCTLSSLLATWDGSDQLKAISLTPPLSPHILQTIIDRIEDIMYVLKHSNMAASNQASVHGCNAAERLQNLLDQLNISPKLIPPQRAFVTLNSIQYANGERNELKAVDTLLDFELIETLVLEALKSLSHPAFMQMYSSIDDQLRVVLDIWGLGDRTVILDSCLRPETALGCL